MSKLRQSILESIRILGNHSGCHQLPERSFFYKGKQFPVCARCTGVFFGELLAVIIPFFKYTISLPKALFLLGIMGLDWGLQALHIKKSTNRRRLITGFLGGLGVVSIYIWIVKKFISHFSHFHS